MSDAWAGWFLLNWWPPASERKLKLYLVTAPQIYFLIKYKTRGPLKASSKILFFIWMSNIGKFREFKVHAWINAYGIVTTSQIPDLWVSLAKNRNRRLFRRSDFKQLNFVHPKLLHQEKSLKNSTWPSHRTSPYCHRGDCSQSLIIKIWKMSLCFNRTSLQNLISKR